MSSAAPPIQADAPALDVEQQATLHQSLSRAESTSTAATCTPQQSRLLTPPASIPHTPVDQKLIDQALSSIPQSHKQRIAKGEQFSTSGEGHARLQDWAFAQGFAVVVKSRPANRLIFACVHHGKGTRNSRNIPLSERKRPNTQTRARDCRWGAYVSEKKKGEGAGMWVLGITRLEHSHDMARDPFVYEQHKGKKPGYEEAMERSKVYRGITSYSTSMELLRKEGLPSVSRKDFYNLGRKVSLKQEDGPAEDSHVAAEGDRSDLGHGGTQDIELDGLDHTAFDNPAVVAEVAMMVDDSISMTAGTDVRETIDAAAAGSDDIVEMAGKSEVMEHDQILDLDLDPNIDFEGLREATLQFDSSSFIT